MKFRIIAIAFAAFLLLADARPGHPQEIWVDKGGAIRNLDTKAILVDKGEIYLATKNEVYKTRDANGKWESIFYLPSGGNEINSLGGISRNIFIGTKKGLFRSRDHGKTWKNVFKTVIPEKNHILSIEVSKQNPESVLIGTKNGIFISDDLGSRWQDISANLRNCSMKCLAMNKEAIYAGGNSGLYVRKQNSTGWERLLVKSPPEKNVVEEEALDNLEPEEEDRSVNCIAIKDDRIYIGMDKDILYSEDEGKNWRPFPDEGLSGTVNYILLSSKTDRLYCATAKGVFEFVKDKLIWLELYNGMDKNYSVNNIIFNTENEDSLWALTDRGVYRLESGRYAMDQHIDIERGLKNLKMAFDEEPAFQELQQAAIRFAEVSPEKISRWRREARMRALFPKVSFGIDTDRSTDSEIYTSATRDYVVVGPDSITNGWDVSISWELGDMIWSDDQTNIDVRSRLMVQLRNDILDDLRRAYYERKRIQFELMTEPPKELKARFEKELRLQELTSAIDDLTGNYLSDRIHRRDKQYSSVDRLE